MERFKWVKSSTTILSADVEMQQSHQTPGNGVVEGHRIEAARCLLGLSEEQMRRWPGALAYYRYLEECFQPLLADEYAFAWPTIGIPRPRTAAECWPWFNAVCTTARSLKSEDISIEDIWDGVRSSACGNNRGGPTLAEQTACFIAIFSVLCWGTMTLRPRLKWTDFKSSPSLMVYQQQSDQPGLKMDLARRPISAIFRHFQKKAMPIGRWRQPISESHILESTSLHVSSLNYASLKTIGKIRLAWVDNLSSHLGFDFANRTLSIFKFPSFCALSTLEESSEPPVFVGLTRALYGDEGNAKQDYENKAQMHQEVLMSYRFLFGQTPKSRRLARAAIRELKNQEPEDPHDQLLDILCSPASHSMVRSLPLSLWPISCRSFEGSLQEESVYHSQDDFPMFGRRLAKLQEFNLRQKPRELRDLWRDRRDPLQWYTFWAVLIVGGSSLLLAILQLVVGVVQVVITYHPPSAAPLSQTSCRCNG